VNATAGNAVLKDGSVAFTANEDFGGHFVKNVGQLDINGAINLNASGYVGPLTSGKVFMGSAGNTASQVTLSGDGTLSNTGVLTLADTMVSAKVLTGYSAGANSALAATDSIIAAFGKAQGQITALGSSLSTINTSVSNAVLKDGSVAFAANESMGGHFLTSVGQLDINGAINLNSSGYVGPLTSGKIFMGSAGNTASQVTLSGDGSLSNTGVLTLADTMVSAKVLTGYSAGTNTALAATDSVIAAFGKAQGQLTALGSSMTTINTTLGTAIQQNGSVSFTANESLGGHFLTSVGQLQLSTGSVASSVADGGTAIGFTVNTSNSFATAGAKLVSIQNAGAEKFYIDKDGNATGPGFFYSSDRRLKHDIVTDDTGLEDVLKMRGVKFKWNNTGAPELGLIAQEVEKVYPELVKTDPQTGIKSVKYGNIVSPLIEAVKKLYAMIVDQGEQTKALSDQVQQQASQIDQLKSENQTLRGEIDQIKAMIQQQKSDSAARQPASAK
jgi:Ethanolamine utilization protein EutJ (predicted chaperonin)